MARVEPRYVSNKQSFNKTSFFQGVDYVLDMILWFKKFRPPHRATLSVRRHAYIQQTFAAPEAITERQSRRIMHKKAAYENANVSDLSGKDSEWILHEKIYLIMPLKGRSQTFTRFSNNLRHILPASETQIELIIIFYQ
jgi:hypothetical protein